MRNTICFLIFSFLFSLNTKGIAQEKRIAIYDDILFYDGYATVVDLPVPEGVIRQRNDLYSKKLTSTELQELGDKLTIEVFIKAACDNYDRLGSINLAFVPKNNVSYVPAEVQRIELGRFVTPFMNKNKSPNEVPFTFELDNIVSILKDAELNSRYDFWIEFEVFGVPYAAQTQVSGCSGRNDVFFGTLEFITNTNSFTSSNNYILPLNFKKDLNNYKEGASDEIGETVRTITFDLPEAIIDANLYLITSNHGANDGGEEYIRRFHYVYFDDALKLTYKPGESSCEPYRKYNTQGNGIYGSSPRTNVQWQSFSNWCPGAKIPSRIISLGSLEAGKHTFKISVPDAVFNQAQGYIPVSLYLQATTNNLNIKKKNKVAYDLFPNPTQDTFKVNSLENIKKITVFNLLGQEIIEQKGNFVDLSNTEKGIYIVSITFENNEIVSQKIIKN